MADGACKYSSKGGGGRPAISAAAIACLFNAGEYDDTHVPRMLDYAEKQPRQHHEQRLRPLALRPLRLRPGDVSRGWAEAGDGIADQMETDG
jgi:hypothetical protein